MGERVSTAADGLDCGQRCGQRWTAHGGACASTALTTGPDGGGHRVHTETILHGSIHTGAAAATVCEGGGCGVLIDEGVANGRGERSSDGGARKWRISAD
ncbi:hypothetical protein C8R44DRAFT_396173 [Mycena epipterygia]|nr:hypothetical protein C8R44DRAFT_396173 [Mycena epipterygia]